MIGNRDNKDITSAFGSDILREGMTSVPNLLLKYYSRIGISDSEMMLVIQLIHLQTSANEQFPSLDTLAMFMSGDKSKFKADLASLIEKGIISINHIYCEATDEVVAIYSYEPLFAKILEIWACEKVKACQQMKKNLKDQKGRGQGKKEAGASFARVCQTFEKEFGRPLSPMEIEQINQWLDDSQGKPELVLEALKRAVMMAKHNFKYIDTILLEWQKNNLTNAAEVQAYEANFRQRQVSRPRAKSPVAKKQDKFRLLYLG